jgi:N utilization substance protein B
MISGRRAAREAALAILFAIDAGKAANPEEALTAFRDHLQVDDEVLFSLYAEEGDGNPELDPKVVVRARVLLSDDQGGHWEFVERLVRGTLNNLKSIDDLVSKSSLNWKLARMSRVDRNILRLAAFELAFESDVPSRATLNEAIEIAKRYGTEESGKFVNGILNQIAQDLDRL